MKHEIEIPDLPDGWEAVAYRVPKGNIEFVFIENVVREAKPQDKKCLIVEKIQPRRIVLEETDIDNYEIMCRKNQGTTTYWKIVEDGK